MRVEVLPGGISYPGAVAIKRGPQILAIDKGLNSGIDSLSTVRYTGNSRLIDARSALPADWDWQEAFYLNTEVNDVPQKVVMVPFAEAGQKTAGIAVWITRSK
jgi:hypothetical protein